MENKKTIDTGAGLLPFDPIVLVRDVAKRWLVVVLAALLLGTGAYIRTDMSYRPLYRTKATFVVTTRGSSTSVYNNLSSTSSLANLFTGLLNSSIMRKNISREMGVEAFDGGISTAVIPNTNLITMSVTASDPRTAFLAAQAIIDHHEELTYEVVDGIVLELLQHPSVPVAPTNYADAAGKMKSTMVLTAAVTALVLALQSFLRDAVRSGSEARAKLDCSFLGEIHHENKYKTLFSRLTRRKTSILISNPVTSFHFVETVRKLCRRVENRMDGGKVLMVTSLLENEGKSTVAVNLALAMAARRKRVLLIDCDLRKPACHAVLDQQKFSSGIKEVLLGKENLSDSILRYKKTNLYLMLARKADRNVGDLLSSDRMAALLEWARENFAFVVLDLPPMSAASDAEAMAGLADASVMVVRQNEAVAPALNKAIAALENHRAKLLGCVLNNVYTTRLSSGQGYGYGYGYGSYGKYGHYGKYAPSGSRK